MARSALYRCDTCRREWCMVVPEGLEPEPCRYRGCRGTMDPVKLVDLEPGPVEATA